MNIQKIFLSVVITLFWLFFILNITYFNTPKQAQDFIVPENEWGTFQLVHSWSDIEFQKATSKSLLSDTIYKETLSYIDDVYFRWEKYVTKKEGRNTTFTISSGLYFFDLYDISTQYKIVHPDFSLELNSPGKIFIDARKTTDIRIFSFDAIADVDLLQKTEKMTSLVLYPHMYFWFNSVRNKFLKNADILRLETLSRIFYVNKDILNTTYQLNKDFFTQLYPKTDALVLSFLTDVIQITYSPEVYEKYDLSNIALYQNNTLFWMSYIEKYYVFFLNKEKKAAYYKKNILTQLNVLFSKNISSSDFTDLKTQIISDFNNLSATSQNEAQEFRKILAFYYKNLLKVNSIDYVQSTLTLAEILVSIDYNTQVTVTPSSLYLNKIYSLIDTKIYETNYLQQNLLFFLDNYLQENNLELKNSILVVKPDKALFEELDFLSFFLKNILLYNVSFDDTKNFDNILSITNIYLELSKNIVKFYKSPERYETVILEYHTLLVGFMKQMRTYFFQPEVNNRWLLVLQEQNIINSKQVTWLNKSIKSMLSFHLQNKPYISSKNIVYNTYYETLKKTYTEYYSALNNYPAYVLEYDTTKDTLLNTQTLFEWGDLIELTQQNWITYLEQFVWIDISQIKIEIVDKQYYNISNLMINWDIFAFRLYPNQFYLMDKIVKNNQQLTGSYELQTLQDELEDLFLWAKPEEKDMYDFRRFFLNTFYATGTSDTKEFVVDDGNEEVEDRVIVFFKRDKLFWAKWDFSALQSYAKMNYDDVQVTLWQNDEYQIFIKKWIAQGSVKKQDQNVSYAIIFSSDYKFSNTQHYFYNFTFTLYDGEYYKRGELNPLFEWKTFTLSGPIQTLNFKNVIEAEIEKIFAQ